MTFLRELLLDTIAIFAFLLLSVFIGRGTGPQIARLFPAAPGNDANAVAVMSLFCLATGATLGALAGACIAAKLRGS